MTRLSEAALTVGADEGPGPGVEVFMLSQTLLTSKGALTHRALEFLLFEMSDVDVSFQVETSVVDLTTVGGATAVLHY